MKKFDKIMSFLTVLLVILYPILITFGTLSGDKIIYILILLQILGFVFLKQERKNILGLLKLIIRDKIFLCIIFLNIIMYMSMFVAEDKHVVITHSIRFSMYIFVYYLIAYRIKSRKEIKNITFAFIGVAITASFVAIYQIITSVVSGSGLNEENRVVSFLENSNNLGAFTIFSVFILIMLCLNCKNKKIKLVYGILVVIQIITIVGSQSRNALIALVIGFVIIAITYNKKFLVVAAILPIVLLIIPTSRVRIMQIFDVTQNISRYKIWESSAYMIKDNPIFGIGYENFANQYPIYVSNNRDELLVWDGFRAQHPHNIFLKIQTELGVFGSIIFMLFILSVIWILYKEYKTVSNERVRGIIIGVLASFIAFQFMNMLDSYYSAPKVIICMFITLGIARNYILKSKGLYQS